MRIGLLGKVGFALAAVGFVPLAIASFQLVALNRDAMTTQVLKIHALAARTAAERTAAYLSTVLVPVRAAVHSEEFRADPRSPVAQAMLRDVLEAQPSIFAVEVTDPDGARAYLLQRPEYEDLVATVLEPRELAGVRVLRADEEHALCRLGEELAGGIGWARIVARADELGNAVVPRELGADAEIALLDQTSGAVIVQSSAGAGLGTFPEALLADASLGRMSGTGRYGDVLGAVGVVPGHQLVVVSRQPADVAEAVALAMRRRAWVASGTAGFLALLFSGIAYGAVIKPIRELLQAQTELVGEAAVAEAPGDELSALKRSFELLAQRVRERGTFEGLHLGRYEVKEVLGEGAMGTVFLAHDPKLGRDVAVKTVKLSADLGDDKRAALVDTLLREARVIARISHPNIVAVHDVEDAAAAPFVVMEHLQGVTLSVVLRRRGALDVATTVRVARDIARGLAAAHAQKIIHHDIKPSNVFVTDDGVAKVMDFGIAEAFSIVAQKRETVFGTPGYLPPEAIRGHGSGPAADVFALGVSMYECLTGRRPFVGKTVRKILISTLNGTHVPLRSANPAVMPELERIVADMMQTDIAERLASPSAVAERLDALLAANPELASAPLQLGSGPDLQATAQLPAGEAIKDGLSQSRMLGQSDLGGLTGTQTRG